MTGIVSRAATRFQNGGISGLVRGTCDFFQSRLNPHYWRIRSALSSDIVEADIAGYQVEFVSESPVEKKRWETLMGERQVLEELLNKVDEDDVVWDIGGSWGMFACPLAATGAAVVSFEPVSDRCDKIRRNLDLNGYDATVKSFALGAERDELVLELEGDNPGGLTESGIGETTEVKVGDEIAGREAPKPTVLKIDVEGAEAQTLRGLKRTISDERCRLVVVEVHRDHLIRFGDSKDDVHDLLEEAGFNLSQLMDRNKDNYHLIAEK